MSAVDSHGLQEMWSSSSNCVDMGFDFGWKTKTPGCVDNVHAYDGGYLEMTKRASACTDDDCNASKLGRYALQCPDSTAANLASTTDVYVFVTGKDDGGNLYYVPAGEEFDGLHTPSGESIANIEFCFTCSRGSKDILSDSSSSKNKAGEIVTKSTTKVPAPTNKAPTTSAPVSTSPTSVAPITVSPTSAPTTAPTAAPTPTPTADPTSTPTAGPTSPPTAGPTRAPTPFPSTLAPTSCDTCKVAPEIVGVPAGKTVCPGEFSDPQATEVSAEDACGNDLAGSIAAFQTTNYPDNNTCAGTVTNSWTVSQAECNTTSPVVVTQIITVKDDEAPKFSDQVLPDVVYTCPGDYSPAGLPIPFASDNCDDNVAVVPVAGNLTACDDLTVSFVATDKCGNEASTTQTVKITDSIKPQLKSQAPRDVTLMCTDPMPAAEELLFSDNCHADSTVVATDSDSMGNYCDGNITIRTWKGPEDTCGNKADDVTQAISVLDQSPPVLPEAMADLNLTCPADFSLQDVILPEASDDCSSTDAITVTASASDLNGCEDVSVTFLATDQCGKTSSTHQRVCLILIHMNGLSLTWTALTFLVCFTGEIH